MLAGRGVAGNMDRPRPTTSADLLAVSLRNCSCRIASTASTDIGLVLVGGISDIAPRSSEKEGHLDVKPFTGALRVTNPVRRSRASSRKRATYPNDPAGVQATACLHANLGYSRCPDRYLYQKLGLYQLHRDRRSFPSALV